MGEKTLKNEGLSVGRNGFLHSYDYYAEFYQHSARTIKRWVSRSEKNKDRIDLDNVEQVYEWWQRNMLKTTPDSILSRLAEVAPTKQKKVDDEQVAQVSEFPANEELDFTTEVVSVGDVGAGGGMERGLDAMFARLEEYEVYFAAAAKEPGGAKPWLDTISRLTATMKNLRVEKEQAGLLIPKTEAEMILASIHSPIVQAVRHSSADFCKAVGVPHTPAVDAYWNETCDRIFNRLCKEIF